MSAVSRRNGAPLKVICLGLPRTGTSSLREALTMLGFGPCYHMYVIISEGGKDFPTWFKIGDGNGTPEDFDSLFRGYNSVLDAPAALHPQELYAAYPDAKFILTTREPANWVKSMQSTILPLGQKLRAKENKTGYEEPLVHFDETYLLPKIYGRSVDSDPQKAFLDHSERVKKIIPPEKLLVYEVGEGWDRLVDFLGVPAPKMPFPHLNDAAQFMEFNLKGHH